MNHIIICIEALKILGALIATNTSITYIDLNTDFLKNLIKFSVRTPLLIILTIFIGSNILSFTEWAFRTGF